jgi:hypothetical protein
LVKITDWRGNIFDGNIGHDFGGLDGWEEGLSLLRAEILAFTPNWHVSIYGLLNGLF